jgi:hypothetical protein
MLVFNLSRNRVRPDQATQCRPESRTFGLWLARSASGGTQGQKKVKQLGVRSDVILWHCAFLSSYNVLSELFQFQSSLWLHYCLA